MNPKKQNQQDKIEVIDKLTVKGAIGGDTAAENKHGNPVWLILDEKEDKHFNYNILWLW